MGGPEARDSERKLANPGAGGQPEESPSPPPTPSPARPPPRIYCIRARDAGVVAVLRRGPSAWAHVGQWDLQRGAYTPGAWLRARLYARRADVSPDGRYLCYLAHDPRATWEHGTSYIAVSRLPWLTALAVAGSCGTHTRGYHFTDESTGEADASSLFAEVRPLRWRLAVTPVVQFATERRSGWEEAPDSPPRNPKDMWDTHRNARMRRKRPTNDAVLHLESRGRAGGEFGVAQAVDGMRVEYALERAGALYPLDDVQWADWSADGRLLVATRGGRLQARSVDGAVLEEHDLAGLSPDPRPAPDWAREW